MPYQRTGRPPGRPPKDRQPLVPVELQLHPTGIAYLDKRAAVLGCSRHQVIQLALREYAERHPVRE
jgi:hypothetical protein